jgi:hypothetical protein
MGRVKRAERAAADDPRVVRFIEAAESYCELVEGGSSVDARTFIERCLNLLLQLISYAMELPEGSGNLGAERLSHEEYRAVVELIEGKLKDGYRHYWMVFEPWQPETPKPICGSIPDDLADIWRDLKRGLVAAKSGALANAVWEWRFSFETHWGAYHATHAIRPLFGLLYGENAISDPRS